MAECIRMNQIYYVINCALCEVNVCMYIAIYVSNHTCNMQTCMFITDETCEASEACTTTVIQYCII